MVAALRFIFSSLACAVLLRNTCLAPTYDTRPDSGLRTTDVVIPIATGASRTATSMMPQYCGGSDGIGPGQDREAWVTVTRLRSGRQSVWRSTLALEVIDVNGCRGF